jgi:hypothetical protein
MSRRVQTLDWYCVCVCENSGAGFQAIRLRLYHKLCYKSTSSKVGYLNSSPMYVHSQFLHSQIHNICQPN